MLFGSRKCPQCGVRSPRKDWWAKIRPVAEHATGKEGSAGVSTANVVDYGWTRSTAHRSQSSRSRLRALAAARFSASKPSSSR